MTGPDRTQAPPVGSIDHVTLARPTIVSLDDAPDIHIYDRREFDDIVRVTFITAGGFADADRFSLASLAATQLRDGTASMSGTEIARRLEQCGARLSAAAGARHRFVTLYTLGSQFDRTLPILSDIITAPTFPALEFGKARQAVEARIAIQRRKVAYLAAEKASQLIMGEGNPLTQYDTVERVTSITPEEAAAFHRTHLHTDSSAFYIAGRVTSAMVVRLVEAADAMTGNRSTTETATDSRLAFSGITESTRCDIAVADARQSAVCIAIPVAAPDAPEFADLQNATVALGGYFGSRLMSEVRERLGLTYGITATLMPTPTASMLRISAECDADNVEPLIEATMQQLRLLAAEPPHGEELARLRTCIMTSLAQVADTPFTQVIHRLSTIINGMPSDSFERRMRSVAALTPDRIAAAVDGMILRRPVATVTAG